MEGMTTLIATLDGQIHPPETLLLRADDLGVLRADGVFDVARCVAGEVHDLEAHLERFSRSAQALELPQPDREAYRRAIDALVTAWDWDAHREATLRLVLTRGPAGQPPTGWAALEELSAAALRARQHGVRVITLDKGFDPADTSEVAWQPSGAKTLGYTDAMAALRYAKRHSADDVIFHTPAGAVLEGATSAVLIEHEGRIITPKHPGILQSTSVARLETALASRGVTLTREPVTQDQLSDPDFVGGLWLVSSGRLLVRVTELNGKAVPTGSLDGTLREIVFTDAANRP